MRFLGAVQLRARPVLARSSYQRTLHTLLDAELAYSFDRWDAHFNRTRDSFVREPRATRSFIGFEQDTGMSRMAGRSFPGRDLVLELRAFFFRQVDVIEFSHAYYNKQNHKPVTVAVTKY